MKNTHSKKPTLVAFAAASLLAISTGFTGAHAQSVKGEQWMAGSPSVGQIQSVKPLNRDSATLYKQVLPGGRVVYTDQPVQGHPINKTITVDLRSTSTWSAQTDINKPGIGAVVSAEPAVVGAVPSLGNQVIAQKMSDREMERTNAAAALQAAEARFQVASAAKQTSETPMAGERSANVNGTSRLNANYFERQKAVAAEFQQASLAYDAALTAARNAQ